MRNGPTKINFCAAALLLVHLVAATASAQTAPVDSAIKGAVYDIGRAEQQLKSLTPSRTANIKRLQRSMQMTTQRLNSSRNKTHPSWGEAKRRLDAVSQALSTLAGGGTAAPARQAAPATRSIAPSTPQTIATPSDPSIGRAQREMKLVEAQVRRLRPSDKKGARRQLKELYRIGGYLAKVKNRTDPAFKAAAQQYGQIRGGLVAGLVKIEQNRFMKIAGVLDKMQPLDYANKSKVRDGRRALAGIQKSLISLGAPKTPAVVDLTGRVAKVSTIFEQRIAKNNAQQASLGDVSGKLAVLSSRYHKIKVPGRIVHPATEQSVRQFVSAVAAVNAHMNEDLAYIQSIDGKAALSTKDGNSFRFLQASLRGSKPQELKRVLATVNEEMDLNVKHALMSAKFFDETDPNDVNHRTNRLTGKGRYAEGLKRLAAARRTIELAALYDKDIGRANSPDRSAPLKKVNDTIDGFKAKYKIALNSVRMPKARSTDAALHQVIAEVAARPKYGYKYERAVINVPVKRVKNASGNIRGSGARSATVTVYEYEWDQFQAITAEKVGDVYYLYANSYKYYYKGDASTPIKQWILHKRFQTSQILKENIGK